MLFQLSTLVELCSSNQVTISSTEIENGLDEWLENKILAGFRIWQLAGIIISFILAIIITLCCCVKFRIPRTKQNIEADYVRNKITINFKKKLTKIDNIEIHHMDLKKALERVGEDLEVTKKSVTAQQ
ncbi:transmembrane inner ear expressed protein isoform X1 [Chelonus insularis]|uniref:transmembrane inner ear expressed protein isoform X1 n=1 Tax=Chelonus insularis TaxID=460826 RepID=UPI001588AD96|nr:transmembrane inner ear expressed protein isoform X1 [Chelonus insularis]